LKIIKYDIGKKKILEILSQYKHNEIVEIGCGFSSILNDIDDFSNLYIVEPGKQFYQKALRDREEHSNKEKIHVYNNYFEDWAPGISFSAPDFIIMSCLLHEVEDTDSIFDKLGKLSNKNTITHISVPNANSFHRLLALEMGLIKSIYEKSGNQLQFEQDRIFDIERLCKIAIENGFKVIEKGSYNFKPFTHKQMQDMIDTGFITERILDGLYKMEKYVPGTGSEIFINIQKPQ